MEVIANNLANVRYACVQGGAVHGRRPPVATARPRTDVRRPTAFVLDLATVRDPPTGRVDETGNSFDLALSGEGYFVV